MSTPLHPVCQPKEQSRIAAIYHTAQGKLGVQVTLTTYASGIVAYSYSGKWGAGSGRDMGHLKSLIAGFKRDNRRMKIIQEFTERLTS